jgi:D-hydroxyproline dehydrogenase subunit beta
MKRSADVIVVGAGVVGSAVTYSLARRGLRVCLVERGAIAGGTSSASAGHTTVQGRVPGPSLDLALGAVRLLGELSKELPSDIEFVQSGGLILAEDETEYRLLREFAAKQGAHVPLEFLEAEDVRRLEPHLTPHVLGGTYCRLDGYVNPMALALALTRGAQALGAEVLAPFDPAGR